MKKYIKSSNIHASTKSQGEIIYDLTNKIWDYIYNVLFEQNQYGYFKQVRRQLTINGRKYVIKNYAKYNTMVITTPEGEEIFKSSFPGGASRNDAKSIAIEILNDAFGDSTDIYNKRVNLSVRYGYTSYGRNSGGVVNFGDYVDRLRRYAEMDKSYLKKYPDRGRSDIGDTNERYAAVLIEAWWSSHEESILFSDNADELVRKCKKFISDGSKSSSGEGPMGSYKYRYYANVIDTQTGEELYADESESI